MERQLTFADGDARGQAAFMPEENREFLTTQILTYIGNKRALLPNIEAEVRLISEELGKERIVCADLFSGSGIVARMLKRYAAHLLVNDLENYSYTINSCYLSNREDFPAEAYAAYKAEMEAALTAQKTPGILTEHYAPKDDDDIKPGERVFYTHENALRIDTYRTLIDRIVREENLKPFFLAPLITEASIHVNTSGVFKGFYKDKHTGVGCFGATGKDALSRIFGKIELKPPVFSNFSSALTLHQEDALVLAQSLRGLDIAYLDPPYNQHPYGSNYFMLNLILKNKLDVPISQVSGITQDWNRSEFNRPRQALPSLEQLVANLDAKFLVISYNSEGFIGFSEMTGMLEKYGTLKTAAISYPAFRGSRNLRNRNIRVSEYLFILKK